MAESIGAFVLTGHAALQMRRRGIGEGIVRRVLAAPEQRHSVRPGRDVLQSRLQIAGKTWLVREFVDTDRTPVEIVTAYRTSRVTKYWRE